MEPIDRYDVIEYFSRGFIWGVITVALIETIVHLLAWGA